MILSIPRQKWLNYLQTVHTLTLHSAVSDLGLHCLPNTLLRVSRLNFKHLLKNKNIIIPLLECRMSTYFSYYLMVFLA